MKKFVLLLVILLAVAPLQLAAAPKFATPTRAVLENGLTAVIFENHTSPVVTLQAWAKVGSRDETDEFNGGAHFIEHMLFKGTQRRKVGQIDREVEALGGLQNAFTSRDLTMFFIVAFSRFFDQLLAIQADALMNSTIDPVELERERRVIIEELNLRDDTPSTRTYDMLYTIAYAVHPYRRPIGGTRAVIQHMTRDQVYDFYRAHYGPASVTIVVVGDIDAHDVLAKIRKAYGGWRHQIAPRPAAPVEPPPSGIRRVELEQDVRVTYMRMGWIGPGVRARDVYAMDVLLYMLGRGRGARLVRSIRDQQRLVQDITVGFETGLDPALFQIFAVAEPQDQDRAVAAILAEIGDVRDNGISDEELARAKTLLEGQDAISHATSRGLADTLGYYATIADVEFTLTYLQQIRTVTREDVQRVARTYLDPQRYALAAIRPRSR